MKICFLDERQIQVSHHLMIKFLLHVVENGKIVHIKTMLFILVNIVFNFFLPDVFFCSLALFDESKTFDNISKFIY